MDSYSGKFVLRLPEVLHRRLDREAIRKGVSLNRLCCDLLQDGLGRPREKSEDPYAPLAALLRKKFGEDLLGVALFGSQVTGTATPESDFDFLIVLSSNVSLNRALYRWWDEAVVPVKGQEWNPQFVHLPASAYDAGGLWLDAALAHRHIWEKNGKVSAFFDKLRGLMNDDLVRRHHFQGQPYWVWRRGEAA